MSASLDIFKRLCSVINTSGWTPEKLTRVVDLLGTAALQIECADRAANERLREALVKTSFDKGQRRWSDDTGGPLD